MKPTKLLLTVLFLFTSAITLPAQVDTIIRAFVDQAARQRQQQQQQRRQPRQQSNVSRQPKKQFDGTWLATQAKTGPDGQTINRTFTLVIKEGKATRTLDTTNASSPEKPFYGSVHELQRRWTYSSIECTEQGTSLTIQWSPGQLADWQPKTVPNSVVEGFGSPMAETAVYKVKGDELTRINDPNGLVYKRAK